MIQVHVLGSGAGGGFPQWNCNCANCAGFRRGEIRAQPRTQSSIAVSNHGDDWVLVNASPDIRTQIAAFPRLQPGRSPRDTAIRGVVLVDSQIDHSAGLLVLREGERLPVYCTDRVHEDLTTGLPLLNMLEHYCGVHWHRLSLDGTSFQVEGVKGLNFTPVPLRSKAPPYSPHRHDPHPGDTVGLTIEDTDSGAQLLYAPGIGQLEEPLKAAMGEADCVLVDGTFWTEDEMQRRGVGHKAAADMGHLPQSGPGGMIELLDTLTQPRKVLIHINNTNPILDEDSPERALLTAHGIEVAWDGMDITL